MPRVSPQGDLDLPIVAFSGAGALRKWLERHHSSSAGIWVRVYKSGSTVSSVTFEELLEEGLCFGWSESKRMPGDQQFYLQRFTPRRRVGTASPRNQRIASDLIAQQRMTPAGLRALGLSPDG
ncbi:MAG: hypothetical protein NVS3B24_13940 [Candidatus Dormibacteria bacterium]